jgi:hypothetical protein
LLDIEGVLEKYCKKHGIDLDLVTDDSFQHAVDQIEDDLEMYLEDADESDSLFYEATCNWKKNKVKTK